tara:strand:- start:490 stop:951 length:462 start_codon:yes stop_codon:yes gene_type:complete
MSRARDLARVANNQALSISSDLNVGINSTSPDGKLDVIGDVDVSGIITATTGSFSGTVTASSFSGSGAELTGISGLGTDVNYSGGSRSPFAFVDDANFITENLTLGTSNAGANSGTIFTKERNITINNGVTLTVADGKRCVIDILGTGDGVVS